MSIPDDHGFRSSYVTFYESIIWLQQSVAVAPTNNQRQATRLRSNQERHMASNQKTVIVTGASQGIGAAVVKAFLERGYNVVGTSRKATKSAELKAFDKLVLVDGDIGQAATAKKVADAAVQKFGSIDAVVNNAGIFFVKPFTDYRADDFRALVSTNLEGYIYITQLAVKQMLAQKSGGSVVGITSSLVENPNA